MQSKNEITMNNDYQHQLSRNGYCVIECATGWNADLVGMSTGCSLVGLCTAGEADLEINMEQIHLESGICLYYSALTQMRRLSLSTDFKVCLLLLSRSFLFGATEGIETQMLQRMHETPVMKINDSSLWAMLEAMFVALKNYSANTTLQNNMQVSMALVRSVLLLMSELVIHHSSEGVDRRPFTVADTYFRQFVQMVSEEVAQQHEVAYYAAQLHITPKYLSEICKHKTGHKAKEIISQILLRSIKRDLIMSGESMKSLASIYGFADQSSLGKFFRKMTGLSPLHYKQHEATRSQPPTES